MHIASLEARLADESVGSIELDWAYECLTDAFERKNAVADIQQSGSSVSRDVSMKVH